MNDGDRVRIRYGRWWDHRGEIVGFGPRGLVKVLFDDGSVNHVRRWSLEHEDEPG